MTKLREAAQTALEALEWSWGGEPIGTKELEAINALRAALAEPSGDTASPVDLEPPVPLPLGGGETTGPVAGGSIPKGWALVPVEPTQDMLDAVGVCPVPEGKAWLDESNRLQWAAMLAAAPQYKEQE